MSAQIMLVDDHDANRRVLRRRLERRGYKVVEAGDGQEAVAAFGAAATPFIIMDLSMPTVSGYEALARIRALAGGPRATVVALTAHVTPDTREKCEVSGFDGFYTKPIDFELLVARVELALGRKL